MKLGISAVVGALLLSGSAYADSALPTQEPRKEVLARSLTASDAAAAVNLASPAATALDDEYRIGANDLLEIAVFQVKELDRAVRVNSRGVVSLPLIGSVQAAGLTAQELERQIAAKLKEDYLQEPQVSVFIKEFTSQRLTIEGQVEKTGIYPIAGRTTLLQAIALAGGMKEIGESSAIRVFRLNNTGTREMIVFDLEQIRSGATPDPVMRNNDILVVEKSQSKAFIKGLTDTLRGFISFGTL